jgi:poly(hydroxyalkanoate) depolymerase family esterase
MTNMKALDQAQLLEATLLTRAGRLMEAVSLLQRALGSDVAGNTTAESLLAARLTPPIIEIEIVADATPDPSARSTSVRMPPATPQAIDWKSKVSRLRRARHVRPADIAPTVGRYISGSFSNAIGSRSYKLYIPSRRGDGPSPLIVMLHGCTQSADDFAAGTRMNFAAEVRGCFVVYPEQPQAANASNCWNWFRSSDQARDQGEPALIAGITRQIMKDHNIDPRRVYVAGLSAGGAAAAIMGEAYPDLYAAVGVHSGLACGSARDLPSAFAAMRGQASIKGVDAPRASTRLMPTIVFHGDLDKTVHPCNGTKVIARATADNQFCGTTVRKNTASGDGYSHSVQRDADGQSVLELWELHGAGHAWSGGSPAGSYTSPAGPNATEEILRFFLEHRRPLCEGTR